MEEKSWSELIREFSPELTELDRQDHEIMQRESALPVWVKYLLAMVLDGVAQRPRGARGYGKRAFDHGASREQIVEALQLVRMFAGRPALASTAEALRDLPPEGR